MKATATALCLSLCTSLTLAWALIAMVGAAHAHRSTDACDVQAPTSTQALALAQAAAFPSSELVPYPHDGQSIGVCEGAGPEIRWHWGRLIEQELFRWRRQEEIEADRLEEQDRLDREQELRTHPYYPRWFPNH
jgi:hypothetical protein